jgi:DNA repair protein RadC
MAGANERLELYDSKGSRTVLRGGNGGNAVPLPDRNRIQTVHLVYQGSLNTSLIRVGEIFKEPLRRNSAAIIVCHNHPSGRADPASPEDVAVTRQIVAAGELLDVEVLDHIILGHGNWLSLRDRGLGFTR